MRLAEDDLELLETYLDGALGVVEVEALRHRLESESELSAALEELRGQRALRQAVWQSIEPDQATADRLAWRVLGATQQALRQPAPSRNWNTWQIARVGS